MDSAQIETLVLVALLIGIALGTLSGYYAGEESPSVYTVDNVMTGYYLLDPIKIEGRVAE